jgi:hypothetical protein
MNPVQPPTALLVASVAARTGSIVEQIVEAKAPRTALEQAIQKAMRNIAERPYYQR